MKKYDKVSKILDEGKYAAAFAGPALGAHDPIAKGIDKLANSKMVKKLARSKLVQKAKKIGQADVGKLASKAGKKFGIVAKKLFKK